MPCGQKKSSSEISHNHTVTPPLAAMEGTTLRLKTATTKRRTRSQRPKTRRKCGTLVSRALTSGTLTSVDIISPAFDDGELSGSVPAVRSPARITRKIYLMPGRAHEGDTALLLCLSQ